MRKLPESVVAEGLAPAETTLVYGCPLMEMTRDELLAAAALGWKSYSDHIDSSARSLSLLSDLRAARLNHL
jgi:hypothetical protein